MKKRARLPEQAVSHCTGGGAGGPCGVNPPDTAKIHIGTCAWTHDDWRGVFYPEHLPSSERLAFYARWFDAVEVDSTFYHIPASHVTAHWAEVTPPGFRFSCKVPREITHERKLRDVDEPLAAFLHGVEPLREKLACLLVQTPWWFSPRHDEHALRDFIRALPSGFPWAVEFRDEAWHLPRIVHLLENTTSRGRGTISRSSRRRMPRRSVFSRRRRTSPSCDSWAIRRRNIFPTDRAGIITRSARGCARSRWKTER